MTISQRGLAFLATFFGGFILTSTIGCAPAGVGRGAEASPSTFATELDLSSIDSSAMLSSGLSGRRLGYERAILGIQFFDSNKHYVATCTSVAIRQDVLLTAAHCFKAPGVEIIRVFTSTDLRNRTVDSPGAISVARVVLHEQYNSGAKVINGVMYPTYDHDLALVFLDRKLDSSIRPVRLPKGTEDFRKDSSLVGYGFGVSEEILEKGFAPSDKLVNRLQRGTMILSDAVHGDRVLTRADSKSSVCYGDSGGPVFLLPKSKTETPQLVALISAVGTGRFLKNSRMAYCRGAGVLQPIAPSLGWIDRAILAGGR